MSSNKTPRTSGSQQGQVKSVKMRKGQVAALFFFDPLAVPTHPNPSEEDFREAKVIYYHPCRTNRDKVRSQVALTEGLVGFTRQFSGDEHPLKMIQTKQFVMGVMECEPSIWMCVVIRREGLSTPITPQTTQGSKSSRATNKDTGTSQSETVQRHPPSSSSATVFGTTILHPVENEKFLHAILKNCHNLFHLFHGPIRSFLSPNGERVSNYLNRGNSSSSTIMTLIDMLDDFVPAYIDAVESEQISALPDFQGFQYGLVERKTHLAVQSLVAKIQDELEAVKYVAVICQGYLIFNSFNKSDVLVVYSYLVAFNNQVNNKKLLSEPFGRLPTAAAQPGGGSTSFGRVNPKVPPDGASGTTTQGEDDCGGWFLLGPSGSNSATTAAPHTGSGPQQPQTLFLPTIHLHDGTQCRLLALLYGEVMVVYALADQQSKWTRAVPSQSAATVSTDPNFSEVTSVKRSHEAIPLLRLIDAEDGYRFVYFNEANHAVRWSNNPRLKESGGRSGIPDPGCVYEMHNILNRKDQPTRDTSVTQCYAKAADTSWMIGQTSFCREFYLFLDGHLCLSKAIESASRFSELHLESNIFAA
eukprot:GHVN01085296.1.p1 GENE.GHVN01085296.1~~GHVN01085296.1.p1  ORF type:complete len:585 (+),score=99.94 GHVN01085296.1:137-1891(+)